MFIYSRHDPIQNVVADEQAPNTPIEGFTLLELLVVIVIIGLLASYVGPKFFAQIGKSETTVARAQINAFEKALDTYRLDLGRFPTTEEGLGALRIKAGTTDPKWNGPYLNKELPLDPWGRPYIYRSIDKEGFEIQSYGKDGQVGGTGDDTDIRAP